jgi:hypothetical protein
MHAEAYLEYLEICRGMLCGSGHFIRGFGSSRLCRLIVTRAGGRRMSTGTSRAMSGKFARVSSARCSNDTT